jgi:hypothetical protein
MPVMLRSLLLHAGWGLPGRVLWQQAPVCNNIHVHA